MILLMQKVVTSAVFMSRLLDSTIVNAGFVTLGTDTREIRATEACDQTNQNRWYMLATCGGENKEGLQSSLGSIGKERSIIHGHLRRQQEHMSLLDPVCTGALQEGRNSRMTVRDRTRTNEQHPVQKQITRTVQPQKSVEYSRCDSCQPVNELFTDAVYYQKYCPTTRLTCF